MEQSFGSNNSSEQVQAVATDQSGNVILVGQFLGSIDFIGALLA